VSGFDIVPPFRPSAPSRVWNGSRPGAFRLATERIPRREERRTEWSGVIVRAKSYLSSLGGAGLAGAGAFGAVVFGTVVFGPRTGIFRSTKEVISAVTLFFSVFA